MSSNGCTRSFMDSGCQASTLEDPEWEIIMTRRHTAEPSVFYELTGKK